ncbi:hypothetical protein GGH94_004463 [Coemansia aciculifera]|uniref:Uncharacterized protein n=1 Tax=Coemansia aciculifera TaxID=417176 RepID=A0A9W8M262_9FUNG|nr:hypothetical protein GGH94_004463 [Coemansia aciculifera]KAJ2871926.1 hypothetical protein GGH93_004433 [Coemansia aciculifera]
MYVVQHSLRSALGFIICAGDVRMFHFGHCKIVSSNPMDIAIHKGWRAFIELLVNLSLCGDSQISCNLTMNYVPDLYFWQIDCPDDDNSASHNKVTQYYFTNVICIADRLCSHHTCHQGQAYHES